MTARSASIALAALAIAAVPSTGLAQQRGGTLVSAEPLINAPAGMQAWRVRYLTTDDRARVREVTGMVVAPMEAIPRQPRRVIAWTHGTCTAEKCAPSLSARFFELTPAVDAVRNGYVVVAPDYPGLGGPGPHPYLVGPLPVVPFSTRCARHRE